MAVDLASGGRKPPGGIALPSTLRRCNRPSPHPSRSRGWQDNRAAHNIRIDARDNQGLTPPARLGNALWTPRDRETPLSHRLERSDDRAIEEHCPGTDSGVRADAAVGADDRRAGDGREGVDDRVVADARPRVD